MNSQVRPIQDTEWENFVEIRAESYHMDFHEMVKHRQLFDLSETRCIFVENQMQATGRLISYQQYMHGKVMDMGGVASIATRLEERGKGYVRKLITDMLTEMKERSVPVSCLFPSNHAIYRRFGWEIVAEVREIRYPLRSHALSHHPQTGRVVRVREEHFPIIQELYRKYALQHNGYLVRSESFFHNKVLQNPYSQSPYRTYLWFDDQGHPQSYMILSPPESGKLYIREIVALTGEGLLNLLLLLEKDNILDEWRWQTDVHNILPTLFREPELIESSITPGFMARIVDIAEAWKLVSPQAEAGSVVLRVQDMIAPWNEGVWEVSVGGELADVKRSDRPAQATGEIGIWTQLFYGYTTLEKAVYSGKLQIHDPEIVPFLKKLWASSEKPLMFDRF